MPAASAHTVVREELLDSGYRGLALVSDIHAGCWDRFGREEKMEAAIGGIVRHCIDQRLFLVFNGDTIDRYPQVSEDARERDASMLKRAIAPLAQEHPNECAAIFVPGNHDNRLNKNGHAGEIERYTGLEPEQFIVAPEFLAVGEDILITHGHYLEFGSIRNILKKCRSQMPALFARKHNRDFSPEDKQRVMDILNGETLRCHYDRIDEFYQGGLDAILHQSRRELRYLLETVAAGVLSANGMAGRFLAHYAERTTSKTVQRHCYETAELLGVTLAQRGLRIAHELDFHLICCGHDHVPQLYRSNGTVYCNSGSILQEGQRDTFVSVELDDPASTTVRLHRWRHKKQETKILDEAVVRF